MTLSNTLVSSAFFTLSALAMNWAPNLAAAQITWDFAEPIPVAGEEFGNRCPRLALDASGNPLVLMGKSGEGLFLATSNKGVFNTPIPIPTLDNVFMADAEGPSIAVHGSTLGLAYQLSGEWATGGQYMSTQDGGQTWSASFPISPDATEDHFMPMLAFDDDGNPFVAVKFGDDPMVVEGVMRSTDGGQTFQPAQPASADVGSGLACECCPSKTIFGHGRYYSVYRQNDENLRDMRLVSSEDGATWDHQLDLDPTDWMISACPETGASLAWLPDGRLASTFRSSGNGASEVYVNVSDVASPMSSEVGATVPVTNFVEAGNQDQPHIAGGPTHTVAVWQENSGGWEIHVASSTNDALPGGLSNSGESISTSLSGSNLHPEVAIHGSKVHVIWKNSGSGQVMYLRGTLEGSRVADSAAESGASLNRFGPNQVRIKGALPGANYSVLSSAGAVLHRGTCDGQGAAVLPGNLAQSQVIMVQIHSNMELDLLRLGVATH